jgi:hypothetical protein
MFSNTIINIIFGITVLLFVVFQIKLRWTIHWGTYARELASEWNTHCITQRRFLTKKELDDAFYTLLASFNKRTYYFWNWKINSFIVNRELWNRIHEDLKKLLPKGVWK